MNKIIANLLGRISLWLLFVLLLTMALTMPFDPDLGWHLRNGADIIKSLSIPQVDSYSWSMVGYPWVPHEWLSDVMMSFINSISGMWGLVITYMFIIAGTFFFAAGVYKTNIYSQIVVAIIALLVSWNVIGVRPQMFTLLGAAAILHLLFRWRENQKTKFIYFVPLVFLLWANLHAGFSIGFIIMILFIIGEFIRRVLIGKTKKKNIAGLISIPNLWKLIGIGFASFVATLLNPSGWKVYLELVQTFGDRNILNQIVEWVSVNLFSVASYNLSILVILLFILLLLNRFKVDITKLIIVVAVFFFSISSWRHVPLFAIVSMPLLAEQFDLLVGRDVKKIFMQLMMPILLVLMIVAIGNNYFSKAIPALASEVDYGREFNYPIDAVNYLRDNPKDRRILNEYNWGGYMIWKLPEVPVFIDGRMAIWKWKDIEIFSEYRTLLGANRDISLKGIERWGIDTIFTTASHPINRFILESESEWEQVFFDFQYVIWEQR